MSEGVKIIKKARGRRKSGTDHLKENIKPEINELTQNSDVAMNQIVRKSTRSSWSCILLFVIRDFNTHSDANNSQDDEEYNEADPSLFTCSTCRANSLLRVTKAGHGYQWKRPSS